MANRQPPAETPPWRPQPEASAAVASFVDRVIDASVTVRRFAHALRAQTGTRLIDWVDHGRIRGDDPLAVKLSSAGFVPGDDPQQSTVWRHSAGLFPSFVVDPAAETTLALKVESIEDFIAAHGWCKPTENANGAGRQYREVPVLREEGITLSIVERHGWADFIDDWATPLQVAAARRHRAAFSVRRREFAEFETGFRATRELLAAAVTEIGGDWACDCFFAAERDYWMQRNRAARVQRARQGRLGLGWANHDHHTYRSSRETFALLIALFEELGFECRERFYAGQEAGWGAQVLEHPQSGVVIFADVDLAAEEVVDDFAHEPLAPRNELGTIGLWCKLHGESLFEAGMHHLECQFDFDAARQQLADEGIETMTPFTDFPYLRQAFTAGENWPVAEQRISTALDSGWIDERQANQFRSHGAVGSHLEILERNDGYKGFNQSGISDIIHRTDPRAQPSLRLR